MGDVVQFKRPRNKTIRGHARACLTEAMSGTNATAVVIVVLGKNGQFAIQSAYEQDMHPFDIYARAEALAAREKQACIDD
jgi:hypothetical protein